jgi:hypothetical protein
MLAITIVYWFLVFIADNDCMQCCTTAIHDAVHECSGDTAKVCIWHYCACKRALTCIARLPPATRMRSVGAAASSTSSSNSNRQQQQQQQLMQWRNGEATTVLNKDSDAVIAVGEALLLRGSTLHQPQRQRHTGTASTGNNSTTDTAIPYDGSATSGTDMLVDTMSTVDVMRYSSNSSNSSSSSKVSAAAASDSTTSSSSTTRSNRISGAYCARDDDVDKDVYIAAGTGESQYYYIVLLNITVDILHIVDKSWR